MRGALLAAVLLPALAVAHEFRPAQLEVTVTAGAAEARWVVEADQLGGRRPEAGLVGCAAAGDTEAEIGGRWRRHQRWRCPAPPEALAITDLPASLQVMTTIRGHGATRMAVLGATASARMELSAPSRGWLVFVGVGAEHMLIGVDHLLFVLAFVLLVGDPRRLAWAVTGFTLGHSATLAAASLGWFRVPGPPVEAVIALSVVFLAREILRPEASLARRRPGGVALGFGLLHGLGFAGALAELLPRDAPLLGPLFGFNLGLELAQLGVVAVAWGALRLVRWAPLRPALAYGIGVVAASWVWGRVAAFWGG